LRHEVTIELENLIRQGNNYGKNDPRLDYGPDRAIWHARKYALSGRQKKKPHSEERGFFRQAFIRCKQSYRTSCRRSSQTASAMRWPTRSAAGPLRWWR